VLSAAGVATSMAQVFSVNAVGYINLSVPPGYSLIANQLNNGDNKVTTLIPTAPGGTTIYKFNGAGYDIITFDDLENAWLPAAAAGTLTLSPGEGAFIRNVTAAPIPVTLVGEVPTGSLSNPIPAGFSIRSSQVPQAGNLTDLGFPAKPNDTVYQFDPAGSKYVINTFDELDNAWLPAVPTVKVGESFFVRKAVADTWARTFNVNTP
jgi:hypothetical protein